MWLQQRHRGAERPAADGEPDVPLGMVLTATPMAMFATNLDLFGIGRRPYPN